MEKPLISIIIPCYNASKFINRCIDSITKQIWTDWEIVCINDGSKDNTLKILEELSEQNSKIKVYTQKNQGAAAARANGILKSTGKYIIFLDADDTLDKDALSIFMDKTKYDDYDIVCAGFNIIKNNKTIKQTHIKFETIDNISYLKKILTGKCGWELCGKMFKKELFTKTPISLPQNIRLVEDGAVFIQLVCNSKIIGGHYKPLYNYIQNENSATHVKSIEYAIETLKAGLFIESFLKDQSFYSKIKKQISSFFLLLYSTSTRRYYLSRNNDYLKYILNNHYSFNALKNIPFIKALYVFTLVSCHLDYVFNKLMKKNLI